MNIDFSRVKNLTYDSKSLKKLELDGSVVWPAVKFFDYLICNGTAYIDTGIAPKDMDDFYVEATVDNLIEDSTIAGIVGMRNGYQKPILRLALIKEGSQPYLGLWYGNNFHVLNLKNNYTFGNDIKVHFTRDTVTYNSNTPKTLTVDDYDLCVNSMLLCAVRDGAKVQTSSLLIGKMYKCTISYNGVLLRDFTPCLYKGEAGMWESVENKFYGNVNSTGSFTVGNEEN